MKRALAYITGQEWAVFVAVVTAALAEAPALAELVQGELNSGKWSYSGLFVLVAGFVVRSKVWSARSAAELEAQVRLKDAELTRHTADRMEARAQLLAAEAVLEAARQGQPLPVKGYPVGSEQAEQGL